MFKYFRSHMVSKDLFYMNYYSQRKFFFVNNYMGWDIIEFKTNRNLINITFYLMIKYRKVII